MRLEVPEGCPEPLARLLLEQFGLGEADLYRCDGPVNIARLASLVDQVDLAPLKYAPFAPGLPERLRNAPDLLDVIRDARRAAAPSVPVVRARRRFHPARSAGPGRRCDQADRLSHRRRLGADGSADRRGAPRARKSPSSSSCSRASTKRRTSTGRSSSRAPARRSSTACSASRRTRSSRCSCAASRMRHGRCSSSSMRTSAPAITTSAPTRQYTDFGLLTADPRHLRRRQRGLPAHHQPRQGGPTVAPAARAVHDAPAHARADPARDAQRAGGASRRGSSPR